MNIPIELAVPAIIVLAVVSALFSATETSYLSVSRAHLQNLIKQGNRSAKRVQGLLKNIENIVGTVLVCNNLINTFIATLMTAICIELVGERGLIYASAVSAILIIVYVEVMPKLIAINNPVGVAIFLSRFIIVVEKIFRPISRSVDFVAKTTLRLCRVSISSNTHIFNSIDELRGAIDLHQDHKNTGYQAMLHSVLDLNEVDVDEIMIHRQNVVMIDGSLNMPEVLDLIVSSPYTRLPVWRDQPDNIIGVLHVKSFLRAIQKSRKDILQMNLDEIVSKPWFIPAATTLYEQLHAFRARKEHFSIVVDEYGSVLGVVTLEDIVEEIVGEIHDEVDVSSRGVSIGKNGIIYSIGTSTIRDLNRQFNWELPDDHASTIAGLILHETRTIPQAGQLFLIQNLTIKILRRLRNQITLVQIIPRRQPPHSIDYH